MEQKFNCEIDREILLELLDKINNQYFDGDIVTDIDWEIPSGIIEEPLDEDSTYSRVPAAGYYPDIPKIVVHPALAACKAPQYVIKYLIYHECLHQIIPPEKDDIHPKPFMDRESCAPNRNKAIKWLENNKFPTMPLCDLVSK